MSRGPQRAYRPVVIIGAPRSGTNVLRDVLSRAPGVATWPCDELPYVWRYGNRRAPTDEFPPERATPRVRRYVRRVFDRLAAGTGADFVVEKTCANSLRVEFVDRILPEARYVFIVRDGRDVVASALKRWTAPFDLAYSLRKARYVPLIDAPFYATEALGNRLYRLGSSQRRLAFWGPRFRGFEEAGYGTVAKLCAAQWVRCVDRAAEGLSRIDASRVCSVNYEAFVRDPAGETGRIGAFLGLEPDVGAWRPRVEGVFTGSVGKGRAELPGDQMEALLPMMRRTLERHGYVV